jgi:hypothetical protein
MSVRLRRALALLPLVVFVLLPTLAVAASVEPLFKLSSPGEGPFPSDRFTVLDLHNNTLLRVNLPKPTDCTVRLSDCQDLDVINTWMASTCSHGYRSPSRVRSTPPA